jgi:hypothetical protein
VFRDDTSLSATPHLWPTIEQALGESGFLILLASPEAAASHWVGKEIVFWLEADTQRLQARIAEDLAAYVHRGRPNGVDNPDASAGLERRSEVIEQAVRLCDFVVHVHQDRSIERMSRQPRIVRLAEANGDVVPPKTPPITPGRDRTL